MIQLHDHIYFLSPHPDDIPLTFGGLLQGYPSLFYEKRIEYIVFFNVSANVYQGGPRSLSIPWIDYVTKLRSQEDLNALDALLNNPDMPAMRQYHYLALDLLDAPLMGLSSGDFSVLTTSEQKQQFIDVYTYLKNFLVHASAEQCSILLPLALPGTKGIHINHFVLREAFLKAVHDLRDTLTCDIYFGEDQPYIGTNEKDAEVVIEQLTHRLGLEQITYEIDAEAKYAVIEKNYSSQIRPLYYNAIIDRAKTLGNCERIYRFPHNNYHKTHDLSWHEAFSKL